MFDRFIINFCNYTNITSIYENTQHLFFKFPDTIWAELKGIKSSYRNAPMG